MISIPVVNLDGQQVSTIEIDPTHFGGEVNKQLLHDMVVMYQNNQRRGTHFTKTRGEVAGSGKKMFRQKGTGSARVGPKRSNKRRGGGVAFGPKPRDYAYYHPKQARRLATRMALLSKFNDSETVVIEGFSFDAPKTRSMNQLLGKLGLAEQTCLIATKGVETNVYLSARNLPGVDIQPASALNAYGILRRKRLLLTRPALEEIKERAAEDAAARADQSEE